MVATETIDSPRSQAVGALAAVQKAGKQFEGFGDDTNPMLPNCNKPYCRFQLGAKRTGPNGSAN